MNHALRRISLVVLAMFLLLLLSVNYVQAFEPSSLAVQRGNARTFSQQYQYQRGVDRHRRQQDHRRFGARQGHLQLPAGPTRTRSCTRR